MDAALFHRTLLGSLALIAIGACSSAETNAPETAAAPTTAPTPASTASTSPPHTEPPKDAGASAIDASVKSGKAGPHGCITNVSAGHHAFTCSGIRVDVEVPSACASGGCGVVLDVHGRTMDATSEDRNTGMRARGAAHGYVVVQPTAPSDVTGPSWTPATDDDKVWSAFEDARTAYAIDPKRVHMTGFSQGAWMTYRFLCKHGDVFASVAPAAGVDTCAFDAASPSRSVSILFMNGLNDPLSSLDAARKQRDRIVSWMGSPSASVVSQDAKHTRKRYEGTKGNTFEYIEHGYAVPPSGPPVPDVIGGHCFPGSPDLERDLARPLIFGCNPPNAFVWGDIVIDFFVSHPMP